MEDAYPILKLIGKAATLHVLSRTLCHTSKHGMLDISLRPGSDA